MSSHVNSYVESIIAAMGKDNSRYEITQVMNSIKDPECMVAVVKQLILYENYNENHLALKACAEMLTIRRITHSNSASASAKGDDTKTKNTKCKVLRECFAGSLSEEIRNREYIDGKIETILNKRYDTSKMADITFHAIQSSTHVTEYCERLQSEGIQAPLILVVTLGTKDPDDAVSDLFCRIFEEFLRLPGFRCGATISIPGLGLLTPLHIASLFLASKAVRLILSVFSKRQTLKINNGLGVLCGEFMKHVKMFGFSPVRSDFFLKFITPLHMASLSLMSFENEEQNEKAFMDILNVLDETASKENTPLRVCALDGGGNCSIHYVFCNGNLDIARQITNICLKTVMYEKKLISDIIEHAHQKNDEFQQQLHLKTEQSLEEYWAKKEEYMLSTQEKRRRIENENGMDGGSSSALYKSEKEVDDEDEDEDEEEDEENEAYDFSRFSGEQKRELEKYYENEKIKNTYDTVVNQQDKIIQKIKADLVKKGEHVIFTKDSERSFSDSINQFLIYTTKASHSNFSSSLIGQILSSNRAYDDKDDKDAENRVIEIMNDLKNACPPKETISVTKSPNAIGVARILHMARSVGKQGQSHTLSTTHRFLGSDAMDSAARRGWIEMMKCMSRRHSFSRFQNVQTDKDKFLHMINQKRFLGKITPSTFSLSNAARKPISVHQYEKPVQMVFRTAAPEKLVSLLEDIGYDLKSILSPPEFVNLFKTVRIRNSGTPDEKDFLCVIHKMISLMGGDLSGVDPVYLSLLWK